MRDPSASEIDLDQFDLHDRGLTRRPVPNQGVGERLRARWELQVERVRTRGKNRSNDWGATTPVDVDLVDDQGTSTAWVLLALIILGLVALVAGSVWAWQSWSRRSAEPIDSLLPVLVTGDDDTDVAANDTAGPPAESNDSDAAATSTPTALDPSAPDATLVAELPEPIIVHVAGAVGLPGVVQLPSGSRVFEAVDAAGGATALADLERVNLAAPLGDGERIHVPRRGEEHVPALVQPDRSPSDDQESAPTQDQVPVVVDINIATQAELQQLPGIGPTIASAIVQTRDERGPFFTVDELLEVPGIGLAKLDVLRPQAVVIEPSLSTG